MLEAKGLVKIYGTRRVVDGVDFRVDSGEIVGLLGPNGAGKTTSFRMTCGMIAPNAGKVKLNSADITDWPMYRRAREGYKALLFCIVFLFCFWTFYRMLASAAGIPIMVGRMSDVH
jgi:ABC-type lipopolysaccharide export system ATPase subunit